MEFIAAFWLRPGNDNQSGWGDKTQKHPVTNSEANHSAFAVESLLIVNRTRPAYLMSVCQSSQQIALSSEYFKLLHPFTGERLKL